MHSGSYWIKGLLQEIKALKVMPVGRNNMRKVVVRKESADTQEYDPHKQKGMDTDVDESEDELSLVPSAIDFVG